MLHEMAADIVDDDGVRNAMVVQFPGSQCCSLISRPGFVDPDMNIDACVMSLENR